jgi:hypothetical protein
MTSGGRGLNLLVSHDMFDKIAGKMTGALTPVRARQRIVLFNAWRL